MRDDLKLYALQANLERVQRELTTADTTIAERDRELATLRSLNEKLSNLLIDTANALKGAPDPRMLHSWHDLPDWAQSARSVVMHYLAATAPGATHIERERFVLALRDWRSLVGRDLFETALVFAEMEKPS